MLYATHKPHSAVRQTLCALHQAQSATVKTLCALHQAQSAALQALCALRQARCAAAPVLGAGAEVEIAVGALHWAARMAGAATGQAGKVGLWLPSDPGKDFPRLSRG